MSARSFLKPLLAVTFVLCSGSTLAQSNYLTPIGAPVGVETARKAAAAAVADPAPAVGPAVLVQRSYHSVPAAAGLAEAHSAGC